MTWQTPDHIIRKRIVAAEAILNGQVDLRGYPYRLISISSTRGMGTDKITRLLAAAEVLEAFGWKLLTVNNSEGAWFYAVLRR